MAKIAKTAMGRAFAQEKGLGQYETEFAKGAQVAQDPLAFESLDMLNDEDKAVLRREVVSFFFFSFSAFECRQLTPLSSVDHRLTNGTTPRCFTSSSSAARCAPLCKEW